MAVRIIQAKGTSARSHTPKETGWRLRVAAYCRVSTDQEEQESSYEAQCAHYTSFITSNAGWELAGLYADEGISGTSMKYRDSFKRLIQDCEAGRVDLVLTKSISRFSRNTLDCLQTIRKLKALGIAVQFEKENINTLDAKGEVLITIMASIAQQESQSISQNVRMGIQYRFQQGKAMVNQNHFLGYTKDENGKLVIDPDQAETVRRIFRMYIEGYSSDHIASVLRMEGVRSGAGKTSWAPTTVRYILQNEKYMGDLLLQKTLVPDFLSHRSKLNTGELPQYYVENDHDPIIPREVYQIAQSETHRRQLLKAEGVIQRYGSRRALSGRLYCGKCGKKYTRVRCQHVYWKCEGRVPGECDGDTVREDAVQAAVLKALNRLPEEWENLIRVQERAMARVREIDAMKAAGGETEQRVLLERAENVYVMAQTHLALELIASLKGHRKRKADGDPVCHTFEDFMERTRPNLPVGRVREYDDALVLRYLKDVWVLEDRFRVNLKSGVTVEVGR